MNSVIWPILTSMINEVRYFWLSYYCVIFWNTTYAVHRRLLLSTVITEQRVIWHIRNLLFKSRLMPNMMLSRMEWIGTIKRKLWKQKKIVFLLSWALLSSDVESLGSRKSIYGWCFLIDRVELTPARSGFRKSTIYGIGLICHGQSWLNCNRTGLNCICVQPRSLILEHRLTFKCM